MSSSNLSVHDLQSISLAPWAAKNGSAIKVKLQGLGELPRRVAQEANLWLVGYLAPSGMFQAGSDLKENSAEP